MSATARVAKHRQRQSKRGLVRVELRAAPEDAQLLRDAAAMLDDPVLGDTVRRLIRMQRAARDGDILAYISSSPHPEVDLELEPRLPDPAREVDF